MTKIAHASGDERKKLHGGKAGDQTGKEVCTREWYNRPWNVVLHWKDPIMADRCATAMERACANKNIGYDQYERNSELPLARQHGYDPGKIDKPCETDCSAQASIACMYAGIKEKVLYVNGNLSTTSNLRKRLMSTGLFEERTASKYLKSADYNSRGDILLNEGHHVAVQIENGMMVSQAYIPDVSHWHPVIDWDIAQMACPVIIAKATQGTAYIDPTLRDFIRGCEKKHIPYWLYAYLNKGNETAQARFLIKTCKPMVGSYFVGYVLDVEADNTAENVRKALDWLKKSYRAMLYTGYADYAVYKEVIKDRGDVLWWEARYGKNDGTYNKSYPCHGGVDLHQYTSLGYCPGVQGKADLNKIMDAALTDFTEHMNPPAPEPEPTTGKSYTGTYPIFADNRDCYKYGDGFLTLRNYPTQIKRLQTLVNWITGEKISVDGKYGGKTREAVKKAQKIIGANVDGIFGTQTLRLAKKYRK